MKKSTIFPSCLALSRSLIVKLLLPIGFIAQVSQAQNSFTHRQKLIPTHTAKGSLSGVSVAVTGDVMVMGAPFDGQGGSVVLFEREAGVWVQKSRFSPSNGKESDQFGIAVAISGKTLIVGANLGENDRGEKAGSVYVFKKGNSGWKHSQKLLASDGLQGDNFGTSIAISENTIVVGSSLSDEGNRSNAGSVYVFDKENDSWPAHQTRKLVCSDAASGASFGTCVSISGNTIAVGAHFDDGRANNAGAAYLFERDSREWRQIKKLTATDASEGDLFGYSVSLSGSMLAIGAFADDDKALNTGSAYVFEKGENGWSQTKKLTASDPAELDYFGRTVSLSGTTLAIGAFSDAEKAPDAGSAYVFEKGDQGWRQLQKLVAPDGAEQDRFGAAISAFGTTIVVGAERDDNKTTDSGSGYVFDANCQTAVVDSLFSQSARHDSTVHFQLTATGANLTYQWYKDSVSKATQLTGQRNSSLTLAHVSSTDAGTYFVSVTDACANSLQRSARLAITRTQIAPEVALRVEVSPNPSPEGKLHIAISGLDGQATKVELFNTMGLPIRQQLIEKAANRETIVWDIARQPQGLYFLRVSSNAQSKTLQVLH